MSTRSTGGNRIYPPDMSRRDLRNAIEWALDDLTRYATVTGRTLDLAAISVDTLRIPNGKVSVTVTADLAPPQPEDAP